MVALKDHPGNVYLKWRKPHPETSSHFFLLSLIVSEINLLIYLYNHALLWPNEM